MDPRFQEVAAALETYFDGLYHSDIKRLGAVFHPQAIYACATDGTLTYHTMASYFPIVAARPAPAASNAPRADRIVSIQFAGPVTALATVNCAIGPKFFTDLLTFVKLDGRWQIMAKVFHFDLQPEKAA
ncbi:nuclear transport factor 2 family protein [Dongia rigui]|uniref:Nuclear transport factor 2 family protein n=1 Tax=Dongia rigui TaxID=940149 RepID=A0ABU5DWG2_9PROT|nr:nuclear transport factor 2 family protein [Dongia rigui]MDY0871643.1 nuclear transport factor 2 family protein [Dongia rigui]